MYYCMYKDVTNIFLSFVPAKVFQSAISTTNTVVDDYTPAIRV